MYLFRPDSKRTKYYNCIITTGNKVFHIEDEVVVEATNKHYRYKLNKVYVK